jgi:cytochrome c biogenesis protein CcmG/thiol:disulfide interchange protein DsbE
MDEHESSLLPEATTSSARQSRRALFVGPLLLFAAIVGLLPIGLSLDPREVPSPLIGKPVPPFTLAPVEGRS